MTYTWKTNGLDADGQSWEFSGEIEAQAGRFPNVAIAALETTFVKLTLTDGEDGGCGVKCPYTITRLVVDLKL